MEQTNVSELFQKTQGKQLKLETNKGNLAFVSPNRRMHRCLTKPKNHPPHTKLGFAEKTGKINKNHQKVL